MLEEISVPYLYEVVNSPGSVLLFPNKSRTVVPSFPVANNLDIASTTAGLDGTLYVLVWDDSQDRRVSKYEVWLERKDGERAVVETVDGSPAPVMVQGSANERVRFVVQPILATGERVPYDASASRAVVVPPNAEVTGDDLADGSVGDSHLDRITDAIQIIDGDIVNLSAAKIDTDFLSAARLDTTVAYISGTAMIGTAVIEDANVNTLSANKLTTGTLAAARLDVGTVYITNNAQIAAATITDLNVVNLDAAKLTTGFLSATVFDTAVAYISDTAMIANAIINNAHIVDLNAEKINAGTLTAVDVEAGTYTLTSGSNQMLIDGTNGFNQLDSSTGSFIRLLSGVATFANTTNVAAEIYAAKSGADITGLVNINHNNALRVQIGVDLTDDHGSVSCLPVSGVPVDMIGGEGILVDSELLVGDHFLRIEARSAPTGEAGFGHIYYDGTAGKLKGIDGTGSEYELVGSGLTLPSGILGDILYNDGAGDLASEGAFYYSPSLDELTIESPGSSDIKIGHTGLSSSAVLKMKNNSGAVVIQIGSGNTSGEAVLVGASAGARASIYHDGSAYNAIVHDGGSYNVQIQPDSIVMTGASKNIRLDTSAGGADLDVGTGQVELNAASGGTSFVKAGHSSNSTETVITSGTNSTNNMVQVVNESNIERVRIGFASSGADGEVHCEGSVDCSIRSGSSSTSGVYVNGIRVVGVQQGAVTKPTGGATVDAEARTAIDTLVDRLKSFGLTA